MEQALTLKISAKFSLYKNPISWGFILLFIFIVATYLPLIIKGGIIADDWGDIAQTYHCNGFINCYLSWFPLFSNRPLAPLAITSSTLLFGTNFSLYLIFNLALFFSAIYLTALTLSQAFNRLSGLIFAACALIPFIAMPVVVSPINQTTATVAFLFWAISLNRIHAFCKVNPSFLNYLMGYLLLLCSFLTYEIMFPLLVLSAFLPFLVEDGAHKKTIYEYFLKFVLPIIVILSLILLWQKIIAPRIFGVVYSRIDFDPNNIWLFFKSWLSVFTEQIPNLIAKAKKFTSPAINFSAFLIFLALWLLSFIESSRTILKKQKWGFLLCSLSCLVASSLIFIISNSNAEISGYNARGLTSTWLAVALVAASLSVFIKSRKSIILYALMVFIGGSSILFNIQRNNYIESWKLQKLILNDVLYLFKLTDTPASATIVGNIPRLLDKNFNDEIVFSEPWDFGAALFILTNKYISGGAVIDTRHSDFKDVNIINGELSINGWWKSPTKNLWFYDFDPRTKTGFLTAVHSLDALKKQLVSLGYVTAKNGELLIDRGASLSLTVDWQDRHKYIKEGWSEPESWGGIWSNGQKAVIELPISEHVTSIQINARAFVTPKNPSQIVQVSVNGIPQSQVTLGQFNDNEFFIPIPQSERGKKTIVLGFVFPNAASPKQLGLNDDDRKLGIGLKTMVFY